ncbi:MAG TPA: hypothetical protein VGM10_02980 [Actinocrinis sp.]|jgi:hypothetical protein
MPCIYDGCNVDDPDEPMLVCSADPEHTAHLSCWARFAAAELDEGGEGWCLYVLTDLQCQGEATHPDYADPDAVRRRIAQSIQAQDLTYESRPVDFEPDSDDELPDSEPDAGFESDSFDFDDEFSADSALFPDADNESASQRPTPDQATPKVLVECTVCSSGLEVYTAADGELDYKAGAASWCSGRPEDRLVLVYCAQCAAEADKCDQCNEYALAPASRLAPPVPVPLGYQFAYEIPGCHGSGKKQVGMLCYAAAAATAMLWGAQQDHSIYECMHFYLMSEQADSSDEDVVWYRTSYASLVSAPPYDSYPLQRIVDEVFLVNPGYAEMIGRVRSKFGSPVFPDGVLARLNQEMSTGDLVESILGDKAVLKGEGNHWTVIYGVRGTSAEEIATVCVYDPMTNGYLRRNWNPESKADYYIVG